MGPGELLCCQRSWKLLLFVEQINGGLAVGGWVSPVGLVWGGAGLGKQPGNVFIVLCLCLLDNRGERKARRGWMSWYGI